MPTSASAATAGLAEDDPAAVGARVDAAWAAFLRLAEAVDLDAPTRLAGWRAREVCVHLGSWPEHSALLSMAETARRAEPPGSPIDPQVSNEAVVAAHRSEPRDAILAALHRGRDAAAAFFAATDVAELGRRRIGTPVGPLPATCAVHSICYELAVHGLDLASAGAPPSPPELLDAGLAALIDVTGALAAAAGVRLTVSALEESAGWRFTGTGAGWITEPVGPSSAAPARPHCGVRGRRADVLDVSAGRANAVTLLATRRLHVDDLPNFLRLAPLVETVPNLPGGAALRGTARVLRTAGGLLGRFRLPR